MRFEQAVQRGLLPVQPVTFLFGQGDVPTAVATVKPAVFDFVEEPFSAHALVDHIELALHASASTLVPWRAARRRDRALAELTEGARETVGRVVAGRADKLNADDLGIGGHKVEVHRARVFEMMDVGSAVRLANPLRRGGGRDAR